MTNSDQEIAEFEKKDVGNADVASSGKMREGTRSVIARNFVLGYFVCIFVMLALGYAQGWTVQDNKDMLLALSGILSGPLGFIIGHYFKNNE